MSITERAKNYYSKMLPCHTPQFSGTDPEFVERFSNFAFDEVVNQEGVDDRTRFMAILAVLLGCGGTEEFKIMMPASMNFGLTPVEIKEIIYQAVDYLGIGRVYPFLKISNEVFLDQGIKLPLEPQATTTMKNRLEKGIQAQVEIFGDGMKDFYKSGPDETKHINKWLAENCFGDYYTRGGLDYKQRELVTFCYLYAQGGCEPQLLAHTQANFRLGNDKMFLIKIVSQCLPYIGYPRTLNAIKIINEASK